MKELVIQELTLFNFKGIRNLTVAFDESETNIYGANGTGKTTIFDAFTWLLFGKDSSDRKDFNIKTLDEHNTAIERIPHEVSASLLVNGEEITLRKCYTENWTKKRGQAVETFNGHSVDCYYNNVPCSVTEYARKIAEICDEQVFKLITNPLYFTAQKKDVQRTMLFKLAGDVTTDEIVAAHPEFTALVHSLTGKTLEEYKREVLAKKRKIKDGIDGIPARIDEQQRDMPDVLDWEKLEADIATEEQLIADLEAQKADRSKAYEAVTREKQETTRELSECKSAYTTKVCAIQDDMLADYRKEHKAFTDGRQRIQTLRNERSYKELSLPRLRQELEALTKKREGLLEEWKSIQAETFNFNEEECVCPTCKRALEADDIAAKRDEMLAAFNDNKTRKLESNKARGKETAAAIQVKTEEIAQINNALVEYDAQITQLEARYKEGAEPARPSTEKALKGNKEIADLEAKIQALQSKLDEQVQAPDLSDINDKIRLHQDSINANKLLLADRERIASKQKRIADLQAEFTKSNTELAELEGIEFNIQQFSKARIEQVEGKINGMFNVVRFKMFEQQINGGEQETCEAMVNGVPFSDLNSAMKINAGLDIINAISRKYGIIAPIVIDNRESVSEIISVMAQTINLIVDANCSTLKIS